MMININLQNKMYEVFANKIKVEDTPKELYQPTFDNDININIADLLNYNIADPYEVKGKIAVEQYFIFWGHIQNTKGFILLVDAAFKQVSFFDNIDTVPLPAWINLKLNVNNYLTGIYKVQKDLVKVEQEINIFGVKYNDILNGMDQQKLYPLSTKLLVDNNALDQGNQITHNLTNGFIGFDLNNSSLTNFVVSYNSPRVTEGNKGEFLNLNSLLLIGVDFDNDDAELTKKLISNFNSDISGIADLLITSGKVNELYHATIALITKTGTESVAFFPISTGGSLEVQQELYNELVVPVPADQVKNYSISPTDGSAANTEVDSALKIYHSRNWKEGERGWSLTETHGSAGTIFYTAKRSFQSSSKPPNWETVHVDGYETWLYKCTFSKQYNHSSKNQYKIIRIKDATAEDILTGFSGGVYYGLVPVKDYDVAVSDASQIFIYEDINTTLTELNVGAAFASPIILKAIVSSYCNNTLVFYQKQTETVVGIVYKNSMGWSFTKSNLKRSAVNIVDLLPTREQNAIKIYGLDSTLNNAAVFQNSYNSTNELASPYFFKEYNNYNNNFYISRVLASKGKSLVFDGDVTNFVASKNLLVLSTIIAANSTWAADNDFWTIQSNTNNKMFSIAKKIEKIATLETLLTFNIEINIMDETETGKSIFKAEASNTLTAMLEDKNDANVIGNNIFEKIRIGSSNGTYKDFNTTDYIRYDETGVFVELSLINYSNSNLTSIILLNGENKQIFNKQILVLKNQVLDAQFKTAFVQG